MKKLVNKLKTVLWNDGWKDGNKKFSISFCDTSLFHTFTREWFFISSFVLSMTSLVYKFVCIQMYWIRSSAMNIHYIIKWVCIWVHCHIDECTFRKFWDNRYVKILCPLISGCLAVVGVLPPWTLFQFSFRHRKFNIDISIHSTIRVFFIGWIIFITWFNIILTKEERMG